jgi:cell wall-associated NlpC family hydrolase
VLTRLRRHLPTLALVATTATLAASAFVAAGVVQGPDRAVAAALDPPSSQRRPMTRRQAKPTVGQRAAGFAVRVVGVPYRYGGVSPASGFDCSGLVYWAYKHVGIEVPHSSYALYGTGRRVSRSHLRPGDVLFFSGLGHVGLYLGRGRMVHAPQTGRPVEIVRLRSSHYGSRLVGARRVTRA